MTGGRLKALEDELLVPPLRHPVARVLLGAFIAVHVALALAATGPTPITLLALLLVCSSLSTVVLLPRLHAGTVPGLVLAVTLAAAITVLPLPAEGWQGYAAWALGGGTFTALALTLRGRIGAAWSLLGSLAVVCVVWSLVHGVGPLPGVNLVIRHAGTLLIGTLFAIGLRRASASLDAFQRTTRARRVDQAITASVGTEQQRVADRFLALAGSALADLSAADPPPTRRSDLLALEGRLRDEITAPELLTEALNRAAAAARRRGVDVVLLAPPTGALPQAQVPRLADWLTARIEGAHESAFVGRITWSGALLRASAHTANRDEVLELPSA